MGIRKMLEKDKPCDQIIIQLNSAKSALRNISQIISEDHLDHYLLDTLRDKHGKVDVDSLKRTLRQYTKMI